MMNYRVIALALLSLSMWGCGSGSDDGGDTRSVRIGVIAPLNAGLVEFGRGIRNSVQLAADQANRSGRFPDYRFVVDARDDSSNPSVGVEAARDLVQDPDLIGVVGTYNSGVASAVLPILSNSGMPTISPGNTDPALTAAPRPFFNYFRLVVPDSVQGPVLARHTRETLGIQRIAIVNEDKPVSQALVDAYADTFAGLGGTVVTRRVIPAGTSDYSTIIADLQAANPELIVFGGEFAAAGPFRQQAVAQGLTVPLMGSDGIKDSAYIQSAGPGSAGDYASSVGAPTANLPGGAQFLTDYQGAGFAEPPSDFGPYAYDAANLLIQSFERYGYDRRAIIDNLNRVRTQGVTGPIQFDAQGDTLNRVVTIYRVQGGAFVPQTVVTVP